MINGYENPATIAADMAAKKGILVVNSAGNEGSSNWNYISAPADADSILAVGAVNDAGQYANFSGNGPSFDGRVKPDVAARGQTPGYTLHTATTSQPWPTEHRSPHLSWPELLPVYGKPGIPKTTWRLFRP